MEVTDRMFGKQLRRVLDRFQMVTGRQGLDQAKQECLHRMYREIGRECPPCANCSELALSEYPMYERDAIAFAMACGKHVYPGGTLTCPDGFMGRMDGNKLLRTKPLMVDGEGELTWLGKPIHAALAATKDGFMEQYMTRMSREQEEELRRAMFMPATATTASTVLSGADQTITKEKLLDMLDAASKFANGSGINQKISNGISDLLRPPGAPISRDVPKTTDAGAW